MTHRLASDEQGAVMVVAAATLTILLLFAGLALDFGRAHLLRAQLQTAVDAAALSGALQVVPMVEVEAARWVAEDDWCTDPVTRKLYSCRSWSSTTAVRATGTERNLLRQQGWRQAMAEQCRWPHRCADDYRIVQQWQILPSTTPAVSVDTFLRNTTWPGGSLRPRVSAPAVTVDAQKVEVTVSATMTMPTAFLKLVGIGELKFTRAGSAVPVRR